MWSFQITFIDDLVRQGRTRKHLQTHTHTTGKRTKINKTVLASIFKQQQLRCNFIPIESNISSPICLFTTELGPIYRLKKKKNLFLKFSIQNAYEITQKYFKIIIKCINWFWSIDFKLEIIWKLFFHFGALKLHTLVMAFEWFNVAQSGRAPFHLYQSYALVLVCVLIEVVGRKCVRACVRCDRADRQKNNNGKPMRKKDADKCSNRTILAVKLQRIVIMCHYSVRFIFILQRLFSSTNKMSKTYLS